MQLDKTISAVVTGGASGLGRHGSSARRQGVRVAILDLNAEAGEKPGLSGTFAKCDVTSEASVDALAAARKAHGQGASSAAPASAWPSISRRVKRPTPSSRTTRHLHQGDPRQPDRHLPDDGQVGRRHAGRPALNDEASAVMICTSSVAAQDGQISQVAYSASRQRRLHDAAGGARPRPTASACAPSCRGCS
jgi:NAD(P)-dependent dehydrogenase (short-subunit alcohol dehydrogenase family)